MVSKTTGSGTLVEAVGLTKVFRDFWMRSRARAVDDIDFTIHSGTIFGMLGPNGSGKSTTIKMILGLLRPTGGRLAVFGRPPTDVAVKRHIGFLPEESYLYRYLTPLETLDYYGQLFRIPRPERRRRAEELLEMVGLTAVAHRPVGEFSKGMTRRIGLAQALINDPELLILDEPTSGLDPLGTRQVKELLVELRSRGKTILLSSHLLADVQDVCDDMVMLYGGRIQARGTVDELLADTDHTLIKAPRLSSEVIEQIEGVLQKAGVGIESVESPRQRLEDLFMDIVEKARAAQMATSGALSGGETAEFLRTDGPEDEAEALLEQLQREAPQVESAPARAAAEAQEAKAQEKAQQDALMSDLTKEEAPAADPTEASSGGPDAGMIEGLLDGGDDETESKD
ncbi:MAG: ABC transporter ATP-binding protein [Phycisphaerales bacterium]|nr:ABC transporter ATP-binding protein [Phycisphaerales bacterium]